MQPYLIPRLVTPRLLLRGFIAADLEAYAAMRAEAPVNRYIRDGRPWDRDEAGRHMAAMQGHWQLQRYGMWAVEELASNRFIGVAGVFDYALTGRPEAGWAFDPAIWGRGYATEAMRHVVAHAFGALGFARLEAVIQPANAASVRIAEKLGFALARRETSHGAEVLVYAREKLSAQA
jgi:RimJ/RimL family protein N-acetyltransferase